MLIVLKRRTLRVGAVFFLLFLFGAVTAHFFDRKDIRPALAEVTAPETVWVIDAGHGGEDGGAVAADGTKESDINLALARKLSLLLELLGEKTLLTRDEDISLHAEEASTLRQKKRSDLEKRVLLVNEMQGAVLVSIHQNSLPSSPRTHGAQVFYGTQEGSDALAKAVQSSLNRSINPGNEKGEKQIDATIYLMKHVTAPAILVECGFLSNDVEKESLKTEDHQKMLALSIAEGLLNK